MKTKQFIATSLLCVGTALCLSSCGKFSTKEVPYYNYDPYNSYFTSIFEPPHPYTSLNFNPPEEFFINRDNFVEYWNKQIFIQEKENRWRRHEPRFKRKCKKWLETFYADLYLYGDSLQNFSKKYGENIDTVLRPTLSAAYAKANRGAAGLEWPLFGFNVKDMAEARMIKISYSKDHWFNVWLIRKDTLKLKVRIEDYRPKVIINGLLNPQRNVIMTPFDRMKIQALVRLYHNLGEYTEKDFTERYAITFTPDLLDALRYHDRDGYDWDKLKIGKEKFTDIRDEDVTYLGDNWFFIAPRHRSAGFIALQIEVVGWKFKVCGFKVPDTQPKQQSKNMNDEETEY